MNERLDMPPTPAMRRNAIAFTAFLDDCKQRDLHVSVGLSAVVPNDDPPNDLVICVRSTPDKDGDTVEIAQRVTGTMREALSLLRQRISYAL